MHTKESIQGGMHTKEISKTMIELELIDQRSKHVLKEEAFNHAHVGLSKVQLDKPVEMDNGVQQGKIDRRTRSKVRVVFNSTVDLLEGIDFNAIVLSYLKNKPIKIKDQVLE
ncbi:hypothetical protein HPP92_028508 [Vanilla planifolia]|uniref:Uncharacterized protein n=1 Tax=Vanilla planifolia TaxID=51239 RepID=A0A835P5V4_VANPL|nr:hypothetical protein HPP92_028508 [Vanilla planifolia]